MFDGLQPLTNWLFTSSFIEAEGLLKIGISLFKKVLSY